MWRHFHLCPSPIPLPSPSSFFGRLLSMENVAINSSIGVITTINAHLGVGSSIIGLLGAATRGCTCPPCKPFVSKTMHILHYQKIVSSLYISENITFFKELSTI